jgi:hypothetical protein
LTTRPPASRPVNDSEREKERKKGRGKENKKETKEQRNKRNKTQMYAGKGDVALYWHGRGYLQLDRRGGEC